MEYFRKIPHQERLYSLRVVKMASSFSISIVIRVLRSQRILYKIDNLNGCQFLNNPLMQNKVFAGSYNMFIYNKTFFKCPILPKIYYLNNLDMPQIIPSFHPPGRFQLNVRIKMAETKAPFVLEVIWKYNVMYNV